MPKEGWETQTRAGYKHHILFQGEEADCGICCCAMVINLRNGSYPTSKAVQARIPKGTYIKARSDRAGAMATALVVARPPAPVDAGTLLDGIGAALKAYRIPHTPYGGGSLENALRNANPRHPVIVQVEWAGGNGFHWVVVARSLGRAQLILDPCFGLHINQSTTHYVGFDDNGWTSHTAKQDFGKWTNQWLTVD